MTATLHPLEPLTIEEVQTAVALVRQQKQVGEGWRFPVVTLKEPHKDTVSPFRNRQSQLAMIFTAGYLKGSCLLP